MMAYWAIFLLALTFCNAISFQQSIERICPRLPLVVLCVPVVLALSLFAGLRAPTSDADYLNYIAWFDSIAPLDRSDFVGKDPVFQVLGISLRASDGDLVLLMLVVAVVSLAIKMRIFQAKDYLPLLGFGLLFLVSRFFLLHEFTQIRAALGIALVTLSLVYALERRPVRSATAFMLAALTHLSVIALVPVFVLYYPARPSIKLILLLVIGVMSLSFLANLNQEAPLIARLLPYLSGENAISSNTLVSFYFVVKVAAVAALLKQWKSLHLGMRLATVTTAYGLLLTVIFIDIDVLSLRLSELTAIFDCICLAYFFKRWYETRPLLASLVASALAIGFYLSTLQIVDNYSVHA